MRWIFTLLARLRGKNLSSTPVAVISGQMHEQRPLPLGVTEFHEWSDRIISGACLPADKDSLKFALAEMIMHLKPTEDHAPDIFFIKSLRKGAANQIAYAMMESIRNERKAQLAKQAAESAPNADVPSESVVQ